jgi:NADPH:quinone reductase-like Zn-dependent oxidoreductase
MKAVVYTKYGSPDVLYLKEVKKPFPKDDDILIKVHAASINSWDWDMLTGRPLEYRLLKGKVVITVEHNHKTSVFT